MSSLLKRWWWVLLALAVCAGLWRLRFGVDVLDLLPPDEPSVQGLKLYQKHFTNARELIVTLRAPDPERAERLAKALASRLGQETRLVANVSWQPPWMDHPDQLAELLGWVWLNQPPESFGVLTNRLAAGRLAAVLADTKAALATSFSPLEILRRAYDPFNLADLPALTNVSALSMEEGQKMFAASEGKFRLLFVQASSELAGYQACASWLKSAKAVVASLQASQPKAEWEGVVVRYTGRPVFVTEIAQSMQRDLSGSVAGTAAIIALLFWLAHRRWLPMLWLLALLALILAATVALGGLVLGTVSVMSMGFAAVLLGLAVDYAVIHYQEALSHPHLSVPEIRRAIAPSILWAAITTISAFLALNLGGLPGLAQLGTLVALGIALAAWVMVMVFLPPLFPARRAPNPGSVPPRWWSYFIPLREGMAAPMSPADGAYQRRALRLTGVMVVCAGAALCLRPPGLDRTGDALRPQHSEAEAALNEITREMGMPQDVMWVLVTGGNEGEVYKRLSAAERSLNQAVSNRLVQGCLLPTALWPRPEFQAANLGTAAWLARQGPVLREAARREGFNPNALVLTESLVQTWARAGAGAGVLWPTNAASQWLLKRFAARVSGQWCALGLVYPATNHVNDSLLLDLSASLAGDGVLLSGWGLLGAATLKRVEARLWWLVLPMVILVVASLWLAFRRAAEILLGLAVLGLSGLCLLATMSAAGWSWNLLSLMGLPLMLGTGVDYSLFIQLALRRHGGNVALVRQSIGRALLLCGGTAVAGFGSLACSSNPGMASLGKVCAVGIGANMLIAVFLLPAWWRRLLSSPWDTTYNALDDEQRRVGRAVPGEPHLGTISTVCGSPGTARPTRRCDLSRRLLSCRAVKPPSAPSAFYRAGLWRLGLTLARRLPSAVVKGFCVLVAELYFRAHRQRRQVVVRNLLPAFPGRRREAEQAARRLYRNFALKLADLWRFEGGQPARDCLKDARGLEIIQSAHRRGGGVLFITLHLGNWEYGGALLAQAGIKLTVLTLAEPQDGLTALRTASRARCGIDTLVIGQDGFALLEAMKQLQAGAALAIAIDRPPLRGAVRVELFGQPFDAPAAAAELARASGCALLGVTLARQGGSCVVNVLPEFTYDRQALGQRAARQALTQQILRAFEPQIRKDIDQWYHFVPIWPSAAQRP